MKIFLNFVDEKRLFRINMKSNYSVSLLKQYIIALAKRKNIPLDVDNIRIRHISKYIHNRSNLELNENETIYILSHKLKGGGEDANVGLPVIYMYPPIWAVFVSICLLSVLCPLVYVVIVYGGAYKAQDVYNLIYDTTSMSYYNNYNIRKLMDDSAHVDLINQKYYVKKYITDCKFTLFKSHLYSLYFMLYSVFVVFTSNLFFITLFMTRFKDSKYKCFIHTNIHPLHAIGISICIVVPIVLLFLGMAGFKLSIFTYLATLLVGNVCILTSVYWNKRQNYKDALKYRDPTIPNNTIPIYQKYSGDFKFMPNYFRYLYYIPIIVIFLVIICKLLRIHPLIWGVLVSYLGSLPSYYVLQNEIPLYCNNSFRFKKTFDQVLQTINSNVGLYRNLVSPDPQSGQPINYYNIFK